MTEGQMVVLASLGVLALAAVIIGLYVAGQLASLKDRVDVLDDAATSSPAKIYAAAEVDTEVEAEPVPTEYREFLTPDGAVHRFKVRSTE